MRNFKQTHEIRTLENWPARYPHETFYDAYAVSTSKLEDLTWNHATSGYALELEDGTVTEPSFHQIANPPCAPGQTVKRHAADPGKKVVKIAVWS